MKGCVCVKKSTRILAVTLALGLGLGTAALAAGGTRTIEVLTGMKVLVNGEEFTPTDVNGSAVDVFAYNGTTYVPIRAMSEAFGLEVGYDAAQQAAVVNGTAGSSVTAPDTRDVVYILSHAPEEVTLEDGTTETFYNEIYEELRWQLEDPDMGFEAEIVSGTLRSCAGRWRTPTSSPPRSSPAPCPPASPTTRLTGCSRAGLRPRRPRTWWFASPPGAARPLSAPTAS